MNTLKTTDTARLGPVQYGIIFLTLATAIIHIVLAIPMNLVMFYLNGLGYIVLLIALFIPQTRPYHRWIRWALIVFTAVTIIGWFLVGARNGIAYLDKLIEAALIALLVVDMRRQ